MIGTRLGPYEITAKLGKGGMGEVYRARDTKLDRVASGERIHTYSLAPDGSRIVTFRAAEGSGAQRFLHLDLGFALRLEAAAGSGR